MSNSPTNQFLAAAQRSLEVIAAQTEPIAQAADWMANSILAGRMVHLFGAGHSRIAVEEMWPRYGSFPGFHPIVELSMTFHNGVVGANGQRQAMFIENVPGLAARVLRNFDLSADDSALVISSGGTNIVPIEMAQGFRQIGMKVVALVSVTHSNDSTPKHPEGLKLPDVVDLVLDSGAPSGDAAVKIDGLETPVAPVSTIGSCAMMNVLKAEIADRLVKAGQAPPVLTAASTVGAERSAAIFEAAYDEHARRLSRLYAHLGESD